MEERYGYHESVSPHRSRGRCRRRLFAAIGNRCSGIQPDAELFALCERWREPFERYSTLTDEGDEKAAEPFFDEQFSLLEEIAATPARSIDGMRAKAEVIAVYDDEFDGDPGI